MFVPWRCPYPDCPFHRSPPPLPLPAALPQPSRAALPLPPLPAHLLAPELPRRLPPQETSPQRRFPAPDGVVRGAASGGARAAGGTPHHRAPLLVAPPPRPPPPPPPTPPPPSPGGAGQPSRAPSSLTSWSRSSRTATNL